MGIRLDEMIVSSVRVLISLCLCLCFSLSRNSAFSSNEQRGALTSSLIVLDDREPRATISSENGTQASEDPEVAKNRQRQIQKRIRKLRDKLVSAVLNSDSKGFESCMAKYESSEARPNINQPVTHWTPYVSWSYQSLLHLVAEVNATDHVRRDMIASMLAHSKPDLNLQDSQHPKSLTPADYVVRWGDIESYVLLKMNGAQIHESTIRYVIEKAAKNKTCIFNFNKDSRWEQLLPLLSDAPLVP